MGGSVGWSCYWFSSVLAKSLAVFVNLIGKEYYLSPALFIVNVDIVVPLITMLISDG